MAGTTFQIKRTGVSGRQPNTTDVSNSAYIEVGELALNFTDGILYSSNGSTLIELGANITNQTITGTLSANGSVGSNGQALFSNGTGIYWDNIDEGGLLSVATDDSIDGNGTTGSPLSVNYGELDIEARTGNTVTKLTNLLVNFLRIDRDTMRNPTAVAFTRSDTPVHIALN